MAYFSSAAPGLQFIPSSAQALCETARMQVGTWQVRAARLGATFVGVVPAPVLFVAGAPLLHRLMRRMLRGDGFFDKRRGWVHPAYFLVHNRLVGFLTLKFPPDLGQRVLTLRG
ncbi:hypothetical protein [Kitasatospora sp. NPDC127116]|uniref:hypothetical protein n=1 Tax=Kitasatospora sp. NPDC127116 TaxID=3345367 RepID=UPI00364528B1